MRRFVKPAEHDAAAHTLNGFGYRDAAVSGAPILSSGAAFIDCSLMRTVELGSHSLFVGEVVDAGFTVERRWKTLPCSGWRTPE